MNDVRNEILDSVCEIDGIVVEYTINVYEALSKEYEKAITILDHYDGDDMTSFGIFQEGEIMDKATGKYTDDSTIMKIIKFIPRLLMAIVSAVAGVFTKDYNKKLKVSGDATEYALKNASEEELTAIASRVDKTSEGMVQFDPNKKEFKLGKKLSSAWNKITLVTSAAGVLTRLRQELKSPNTPYKKFAEELKAIFKGEKTADEGTIALGANAFKNGLYDACKSGYLVSSVCKELSGTLEKKCKKDCENGKDPQKAYEIKLLLDQLSETSKTVANVTLLGRIGNALFSDIAITRAGKAKASSGVEKLLNKMAPGLLHTGDYDELYDLDAENNATGANIRGKNKTREVEEDIHDQKMSKRETKKKLTEEEKEAEERLKRVRDKMEDEEKEYDSTGKTSKRPFTDAPGPLKKLSRFSRRR